MADSDLTNELPNLWHAYNLQANPYFQDYLREGDPPVYPLDLFVGRDAEVDRLLRGVGGSTSSRQCVAGPPGIGKTTLAQRVKEVAAGAGYVTHAHPVGVYAQDNAPQLLTRVLAYVYEALLGALGASVAEQADMEETREIVRAARVSSRSLSIGLNLGAVSAGAEQTRSYAAPLLIDVPSTAFRLLTALERLACLEHGKRGVLIHLNNFENLAGADDYGRAADVLRDVRDFLMLHNYHWLVVGTEEALSSTLFVHRQVQTIFPGLARLDALTNAEFRDLLAKRYRHLRRDPSKAAVPPVSAAAALAIYALYGGDLRGTLRALEEAADILAGYGREAATRSLEEADVLAALRSRYAAAFEREASAPLIEQFVKLRALSAETFTQDELIKIWGVTRPRVSQVLTRLRALGYVREAAREGRRVRYELTGSARIIFS